MQGAASTLPSCAEAIRALLAGRWDAWNGLPASCSLAELARELGGATMLDHHARLGGNGVPCARSRLGGAPLLVWHQEDRVLLVEGDLLGSPQEPPSLNHADVGRLDIRRGAILVEGGEAVIAGRGLALILTSEDLVVGWRGFAPMELAEYLAGRRPQSQALRPFRAAGGTGEAGHGE